MSQHAVLSPSGSDIWAEIPGYEGRYAVSRTGSVKSLNRVITDALGRTRTLKGKVLALMTYPNGYLGVTLGRRDIHLVHRLVAKVFLPAAIGLADQVNHKNGIRGDNRLENLEWVTCSDNHKHSYRELSRKKHAKTTPVVVGGVRYESELSAARALRVSQGSINSARRRGHRCCGMEVSNV